MIPEKLRAFTIAFDEKRDQLKSNAEILYNGKKKEVTALWDTGATKTCISKDVVSFLNLNAIGVRRVLTPSGVSILNTYIVDIALPNDCIVKNIIVSDSEIGNQGIGLLIGMDIIGFGSFAVSTVAGKTSFSFSVPSFFQTNYVKEIEKLKNEENSQP